MRKLLKYLTKYRKESIMSPLFKMLEACFELTVPLVISSMIDRGIGGEDSGYVIKCFAILIALGLIGLLASVTAQFFAAKAATGFATGLRHDLFRHLMSLNYSSIDNLGTSAMITRMTTDVNTTQNGVNMFLRLFLRSPFIVIGATVMAFTINVKAALIFVGVVALLSLVVFLIMKTNIPMLKKTQGVLDDVLNLTRENLSGVRVIRAFNREEKEYESFKNTNSLLVRLQLKAGRISGLLNPLTYVVINLAIVALIGYSGTQVNANVLTTGAVVALYNYMSQILLELIKFAGLIVTINKALASANRIAEVFEIPEGEPITSKKTNPVDSQRGMTGPSIEFKNVSLKYHEDSDEALTDISFFIPGGSTFGVIGGTGSGKTSVINLIPAFYSASSGTVFVNDKDIHDYEKNSLRDSIGIVTQKSTLFSGTIRDNLKWGNETATDEEMMEAIRLAVATDVVEAKGGLDAAVEADGKNFSGGQRQRLCIARALVRKPSILILDDASSALDYVTDRVLRNNLKALDYSPTVLIVSQRSSTVMEADNILVLDNGEQVGLGTHSELRENCPVYEEIYVSQYGNDKEES